MAYGRALDYEASWGLATDVFTTVSKLVKPERNPRLAVEANVAVGGAARRNGEWDISARGYSQAAYIADTLGDRIGVLTVQIGIANTYVAKGNLPAAESILDDVIVQARDQDLPEVQADALHGRAALAARQGNAVDGLKLAHEALRLMQKPAAKDVLLEDIAGMFTQLGLRDAARDTHMVLAASAQAQVVRWSAILNLMELAGLDGNQAAFDSYARELSLAPLGPWIRSHYLLFLGEGFSRLERLDAAIEALNEAANFAEANQIHHIAFKAEAALVAVRSARKPVAATTPDLSYTSHDVFQVVQTISELRKSTLAVT
jgi:tetratricopeptide (TPR) repeat protein